MNDLIPCPDCSRHVRRAETSCPFCGAGVAAVLERTPPLQVPTTRLGRAALFTFAAASIGAAACGGDEGTQVPGPTTGGSNTGASASTGGGTAGGNQGAGGV